MSFLVSRAEKPLYFRLLVGSKWVIAMLMLTVVFSF
jgi:hypothetical protein